MRITKVIRMNELKLREAEPDKKITNNANQELLNIVDPTNASGLYSYIRNSEKKISSISLGNNGEILVNGGILPVSSSPAAAAANENKTPAKEVKSGTPEIPAPEGENASKEEGSAQTSGTTTEKVESNPSQTSASSAGNDENPADGNQTTTKNPLGESKTSTEKDTTIETVEKESLRVRNMDILREFGVPYFLMRYMEAEQGYSSLDTLLASNIRAALGKIGYSVKGIEVDNKGRVLVTNSENKKYSLSSILEQGLKSNNQAVYDVKLDTSEVTEIQKEILRCVDMDKLGKYISEGQCLLSHTDPSQKGKTFFIPYSLQISMGNILRESMIRRYRLMEDSIKKETKGEGISVQKSTMDFIVEFTAERMKNISDDSSKELKKSIFKNRPGLMDATEYERTVEISKDKEGFSVLDEEERKNLPSQIRDILMAAIEKNHKGGLNFNIEKKIENNRRSTVNKTTTTPSTVVYTIEVVLEKGDKEVLTEESNDIIKGYFTLRVNMKGVAGNDRNRQRIQSIKKGVGGLVNALSNIQGNGGSDGPTQI